MFFSDSFCFHYCPVLSSTKFFLFPFFVALVGGRWDVVGWWEMWSVFW